MAVQLKEPEKLMPVAGFRQVSCVADIYRKPRHDLVLIEVAEGANSAAVFTKNAFAAAPVIVARSHLSETQPRYCLINAGNANAGTGKTGMEHAMICCTEVARIFACRPAEVLPFSTGVIGEYLPVDNISMALDGLGESLGEDNWLNCANAIMTTDTVAKGASRLIDLDGKQVTITGIAKGSGMIRPDMATMLAFIATDAAMETDLLSAVLEEAVSSSFNRICVDGDTSTNDACVLMASGKSGVEPGKSELNLESFKLALQEICLELAHAIVRDGEGATKFINVQVLGGSSEDLCREIAYDIATSPLVKTAMFASDPNWGRIIAAIGRSRTGQLEPDRVSIFLNDLCIVSSGGLSENYTEEAGQREMNLENINLTIDLGAGGSSFAVWTCDLSHDYVSINADYRS